MSLDIHSRRPLVFWGCLFVLTWASGIVNAPMFPDAGTLGNPSVKQSSPWCCPLLVQQQDDLQPTWYPFGRSFPKGTETFVLRKRWPQREQSWICVLWPGPFVERTYLTLGGACKEPSMFSSACGWPEMAYRVGEGTVTASLADLWVVLLCFARAPDETAQWHAGASSELWPREIPPLSLCMTYFAKWQSWICHSTRQTGRWFSSPLAWSLFSPTTLQGSLLKSSYLLVFMHEMSKTLVKCLLFSMCIFFFKTLALDTSWNYWYEALNLYNGAVFWSLTPWTSILLTRWSCLQCTGWSSH